MKRRLEAGATERTVLGASSASQVWVRCLSFPFGFTSTSLLLLHLGGQAAPGELHGDLIANGHLFGGAHNIARSVVTDRVPALEHARRAALIEWPHQPLRALALGRQEPLEAHPQVARALLEPQTQPRNSGAKIKRRDARLRDAEAPPHQLEARPQRHSQPPGEFIQLLAVLPQHLL